ncbi:MAG: hypothetical protein IPL61_14830 [Myxococcales bacterium]|nr:hypothetical protein [Myxococcales bacterium]
MAKPSIAILGLEVVEESDTPDAKAAQYAEVLTDALRARARLSSGPFVLAAGSDKSLVEMKLLSGCDNEANACMAGIGVELAADRLIYGHIQKSGANYQISLKLLNVSTKSIERTTSDLAPAGDDSSGQITALGKKLYAKITGVSNQGTLIIKANVERGEVFLDGERKAGLSGGTARIEGLAAGDYKLKIETDCYLAHEGTVTVEGGKDVKEEIELEKNALSNCGGGGGGGGGGHIIAGGVSDDDRPGGGSRALFWVSTGVAAAGAGFWIYNWRVMENTFSDNGVDKAGAEAACPGAPYCDKVESASRNTYIGGAVLAVGAVAGAYFFYKGYLAPAKRRERPLNARAPRREILIAPTVSAKQVGGVVRIEF